MRYLEPLIIGVLFLQSSAAGAQKPGALDGFRWLQTVLVTRTEGDTPQIGAWARQPVIKAFEALCDEQISRFPAQHLSSVLTLVSMS